MPFPPLRASAARRRLSQAALALAVLALAYGAVLAAASTGPARAWLRSHAEATLRQRLGEVTVGDRTSVDALLRVSFGPIERRSPDGLPLLRIELARVRPSLAALLAGRVEPASVRLEGLRAEGLAIAGRAVPLGPLDADLDLSGSGARRRLRASVFLPAGGSVWIDARRDASGWHGRIHAAGIALGAASAAVRAGTATLDLEGETGPDPSRASARLRAVVEGVVLAEGRIAERPLGPLRAAVEGTLGWEGDSRRISLSEGVATLPGGLSLDLSGDVRLTAGAPFSASVRAAGVGYAALAAALPEGLAPPPSAPLPPGTFDARLELAGPLRAPAGWSVSASLDLSRMRALARRAPLSPLLASFPHHPFGAEPGTPPFVVGPENPDFVPIAELPEHVIRAVTTAEDAGFFAHAGFDFEELRNALAQGTEAGHLVRGGSTISQQLAKNLYLGPERTLARKVREALATVALEASVPKRRLLEIYLNVAEWGPGVWGIGPAARAWLGKDARELTPKEAAFLASVIPNPVRFHALLAHDSASGAFEERVRRILLGMTQNGTLTEDQLLDALDQPLRPAGG